MYKIFFATLFLVNFGAANAQYELVNLPAAHSIRAMVISKKGTVWISGSKGAIYKNSGKNWENYCPEEYKSYDFRGINILSENTLIAMSAGEGESGKAFLLKTTTGGKTWQKIYQDTTKGAFFDSIKFLNSKEGWLLGDQIDGTPYLRKTIDGGKTWLPVKVNHQLIDGEASFAASNSCIALYKKNVWFTTQNRMFFSPDNGTHWQALATPFLKTSTQGIFGIFFKDHHLGFAVGGDYQNENSETLQFTMTIDGGKTWQAQKQQFGQGVSESVAIINNNLLVVAGTKGIVVKDLLKDKSIKIADGVFHVVKCNANHCIAAGANGQTCFFEIDKNFLP